MVQETTSAGSNVGGLANPTGSKAKQAHWGGPSRKKRRVCRMTAGAIRAAREMIAASQEAQKAAYRFA